jgi:hypothetical protein
MQTFLSFIAILKFVQDQENKSMTKFFVYIFVVVLESKLRPYEGVPWMCFVTIW